MDFVIEIFILSQMLWSRSRWPLRGRAKLFDGGLIVRSHEQPSGPRVVTEHPTCDPGLSIFQWASRSQLCGPKVDQKYRIFRRDTGRGDILWPCPWLTRLTLSIVAAHLVAYWHISSFRRVAQIWVPW